MDAIPMSRTYSKHTEVLVGRENGSIRVVQCTTTQAAMNTVPDGWVDTMHEANENGVKFIDMRCNVGTAPTCLTVSPDGHYFALYIPSAKALRVITTDFRTNRTRLNTMPSTPHKIVWCGTDTIIVLFNDCPDMAVEAVTTGLGPASKTHP
jgi:hypothetical protein